MSLLSLMLIVPLQGSIEQVMNQSGIEWVKESTPNYTYMVKEEMKKSHGKVIEPSFDVKYAKNKLNSGINRIVTTIEPVGHEYKIITETWNDKNGSYLTWENAALGAAALGTIGVGVAGAYAYNEYNKLNSDIDKLGKDLKVANDDLFDYETDRQLNLIQKKSIGVIYDSFDYGNEVRKAQSMWLPSQAYVDQLKAKEQKLAVDMHNTKRMVDEIKNNQNYSKERDSQFKEKLAAKDKAREEQFAAELAVKNNKSEKIELAVVK